MSAWGKIKRNNGLIRSTLTLHLLDNINFLLGVETEHAGYTKEYEKKRVESKGDCNIRASVYRLRFLRTNCSNAYWYETPSTTNSETLTARSMDSTREREPFL